MQTQTTRYSCGSIAFSAHRDFLDRRSHPLPSERLAQANSLIALEGWQDRKAQRPFHVEYEVQNGKYVK